MPLRPWYKVVTPREDLRGATLSTLNTPERKKGVEIFRLF